MIGISTWCHLIILKAIPFPKDGSFLRSPATTSGQLPFSCIKRSRSVVQRASTATLDIGDAVASAVVFCTVQTLCGIVVAGKPAFVLCPGQGTSGARRFIRFFQKGPRWTEVISMGCGPGSLKSASVLRGLVQCGLLICSRSVVYCWVSTGSTLGYSLKVFTE